MSIQHARQLRLAGRYSEAVEVLNSTRNIGDIGILRELLLNHFRLRQIDELIKTAGLIQTLAPAYGVEALAHCGLLLRGLGSRTESIEYFRAALVAQGNTHGEMPEWLYSEFSGVLIDQRNWTEALEVAMAGVAVKPALNLTVAHIQIRLGNFTVAHEFLRKAKRIVSGDPAKEDVFLSLATELWIHAASEEVREWICAAPISVGGIKASHLSDAELAAASGNHEAAATIWLRVSSEHKSMRHFVMRRIVETVRQEPGLLREFCPVYEGLMELEAASQPAVFAYYEYLVAFMSHDDAVEMMLNSQVHMPRLLPALAVELVRWGRESQLRDRASHQIDSWQRSSQYIRCGRFLDAICTFRPLPTEILESLRTISHSNWLVFLLFRMPRLRAVGLWETADSDMTLLRDGGIQAPLMREWMNVITGISSSYEAYLETAEMPSAEVRKKVRNDERFVAFQDQIVRDRKFSIIDPLTGNSAQLLDSVKIFDRQVFTFIGAELVLAISGGNMNALAFIYVPSINLLIPIEGPDLKCSQNYYGSNIHMADLLAVYLARVVKNYAGFLAAAAEAPLRKELPRTIVAIHGRAENPAHHSWNYLSAFERLAIEGLLPNVSCVVRPPTEYFGDVRCLFPELQNIEMMDLPEHPAIDPKPFSVDHVVVQLGGNFITRGLKKRLQTWAIGQVSPERLHTISAPAKRGQLVIWFGLRVGDKVWVSQEAGLISVIDAVCAKHPGSVFLLDGFSVSRDGEAVPVKWAPAVAELRGIAERIKAGVSQSAEVIDLLGNTLAEALVWAMNATIYFTPMGSSQHKIGWYSDCHGLVYTSAKFAGVRTNLLPGAWEAEGSAVPEYLIGKIAAAGRRRGHYDFRSNLENIEINALEVSGKVLEMLGKHLLPS